MSVTVTVCNTKLGELDGEPRGGTMLMTEWEVGDFSILAPSVTTCLLAIWLRNCVGRHATRELQAFSESSQAHA